MVGSRHAREGRGDTTALVYMEVLLKPLPATAAGNSHPARWSGRPPASSPSRSPPPRASFLGTAALQNNNKRQNFKFDSEIHN